MTDQTTPGAGKDADAEPMARRPDRQVGRRERVPGAQAAHDAAVSRPVGEEGSRIVSSEAFDEPVPSVAVDPREDRIAELQVSGLFLLAIVATLGFCVAYFLIPQGDAEGQYLDYALGTGLTVSLLGIGSGMILWAKKLMSHDKAVQEREPFHSPEEEELLTEETFFKGVASTRLGSLPLLRRTLIGAMALFPLPLVVMLRDLGPLPHDKLRTTGWKAGDRLVDLDTKLPVKLGDLSIGGIQTVMPEGFTTADDFALAPTILIRFGPGQIRDPHEANWGADNHVAYSKICTHAGCPISLFEQQTHHLLCPCHQSTFQMDEGAKVIFGPAARALPQLRIYLDDQGYFRAKGDYSEPVGPSFWERG